MPARPHAKLAEAIGHHFSNDALLKRALTHPSHVTGDPSGPSRSFERLEFLGDRVLGLIVAELLFEAFPESAEGGLAARLNLMVRKESCASVAGEIDLGAYIVMSPGEADAGGRHKKAILANACEALIAAIYVDGGLEAARRFIERYWKPYLGQLETPPQDAKTALQEWAQSLGRPPPSYHIESKEGPVHEPLFTISVAVEEHGEEHGEGRSKRLAEQAAAARMLVRQGVWQDE